MNFGFDFGPGGAGPSRRRGKGEDAVIPHTVTLDELYNGKTLKLNLEKEAVCGSCKGYALVPKTFAPITIFVIVLVREAAQSQKLAVRVKEKDGRLHKRVWVPSRSAPFSF